MGRSYLTVVVCQVIAAVAAIAALRWLATYVDPETFGQYALFQSVVSAAALFFVSWPNSALLRFGREEWVRDGRVGITFGARALLFAGCTMLAVALAWLFDSRLRTFLHVEQSPFMWIALAIVVVPAAELAIYVNQAVGRTEVYGYSPVITRVGFLAGVLLIPLLALHATWTYLAIWMIASTAAAAVFSFATMPVASWSGFRVRSPTVLALLKYSWTLPFAAVSTYVVNWIDMWVIRAIRGVGSVGVYGWAYQITAIAGLAFAPIAVVLTPRVIDARLKHDDARIGRYVDSILPAATALAAIIGVLLVLVFPALRSVASPAYAAAYPVILILLAALPFQLIAYLVTPLANAYERLLPRIVLVSAAVALTNTLGDLVLVPRLGISGAAVATTLAFTLAGLLMVVVVRREGLSFGPLWRYAMPGAIVFPSAAVLCWVGPTSGALIIGTATATLLGVAAYSLAGPAFRVSTGRMAQYVVSFGRALALSDQPLEASAAAKD
jgi:O-antigen/teichoic acid export membrane protein